MKRALSCAVGLAAAGALAIASSGAARARELTGQALVRALQHGGYVIVMRHAHAPDAPPGAAQAETANTGHERQLDGAGRASATALGAAFKALRLPIQEVWSSPTYRARETVALAQLPAPHIAPELGDQGHSMQAVSAAAGAWLRTKASAPPPAGTDTVIVTQMPNIAQAFGEQAKGLGDGGALVFRPAAGKPPELIARIGIGDWPKLAGR